MKLSDVVSHATGLAIYAEIGMVLFLIAFVLIWVDVMRKQRRPLLQDQSMLPLDDGTTVKADNGQS